MRIIIVLISLLIILVSCSPYSGSPVGAPTVVNAVSPTETIIPSATLTPTANESETLSISATLSETPDPANQIFFSPDGKYVAKRYDPYGRPSLEKPVIEIFDDHNELLWQIPYQGEMPTGDPRPSLSIYQWANDSSALYFYYIFRPDGRYNFWDGLDLQKVNIETGIIEQVLPGTEIVAFAISPDGVNIAYARSEDNPRKLIIRNLSTKSEKYINIDVESKSPVQLGWISWSPRGENVLYHVESEEEVWAYYLDVKTLQQKEILRFWLEEYWFDGWAQGEKPRYVDLHKNVVIIDAESHVLTVIGTATPMP